MDLSIIFLCIFGGFVTGMGVAKYQQLRVEEIAQHHGPDYAENLRRNYGRSKEASPITPPLEAPVPAKRGRPRKQPVEMPREPVIFTRPHRRSKIN